VDPRLHRLQRETELVTDLEALRDCYREKLAEMLRHQAGARSVQQYDANNTYQYIINREETQLSWVAAAVRALGGTIDDIDVAPPNSVSLPSGAAAIETHDAAAAQSFVDRWRPRMDALEDARYRGMLRVIIGETLEQKRFFEQALAGRTDLLGRRSDAVGARVGTVLPTRWIE
jgi:hypothetical protein